MYSSLNQNLNYYSFILFFCNYSLKEIPFGFIRCYLIHFKTRSIIQINCAVHDFTSDSSVDSSLSFLPWKKQKTKTKKKTDVSERCVNMRFAAENIINKAPDLSTLVKIFSIKGKCCTKTYKTVIILKSYI